jgi:hypothetical protein
MATVSITKIKIRRGTDLDRQQVILDSGEIGYTTDPDSRRLFVGDGSTKGGNPAGIKFYTGALTDAEPALTTAQVGDLIFNTTDSKMYALTGYTIDNLPDYDNPDAYQFIGSRIDGSSIEYSSSGSLRIKQNGVTQTHINNNVIDNTKGLTRSSSTGPISVRIDNSTLQFTGGQVAVNIPVVASQINLGSINTLGQTINASDLTFTGLPTTPQYPGALYVEGGYLRIS